MFAFVVLFRLSFFWGGRAGLRVLGLGLSIYGVAVLGFCFSEAAGFGFGFWRFQFWGFRFQFSMWCFAGQYGGAANKHKEKCQPDVWEYFTALHYDGLTNVCTWYVLCYVIVDPAIFGSHVRISGLDFSCSFHPLSYSHCRRRR